MNQATKQQTKEEQIQEVFGEEKVRVFIDKKSNNSILITQIQKHELGKDGMISLTFHQYQIEKVAKILKGYKLITTGLNTFDHSEIDKSVSSELTLYFRRKN